VGLLLIVQKLKGRREGRAAMRRSPPFF